MLYRFRRRLYHLIPRLNVELMYVHDLKDIKIIEPRIDLKVFKFSLDDIDRIKDVKNLPIEKMRERLVRGDACYATEIDEEIGSYQWVQYSGQHFIQQAGYHTKITNGSLMIYHARVSDKFKGNRINGLIKSTILLDAKNENMDKAWVYTNLKNAANRKGLESLGFKLESKIYSIEVDNRYYQLLRIHK